MIWATILQIVWAFPKWFELLYPKWFQNGLSSFILIGFNDVIQNDLSLRFPDNMKYSKRVCVTIFQQIWARLLAKLKYTCIWSYFALSFFHTDVLSFLAVWVIFVFHRDVEVTLPSSALFSHCVTRWEAIIAVSICLTHGAHSRKTFLWSWVSLCADSRQFQPPLYLFPINEWLVSPDATLSIKTF